MAPIFVANAQPIAQNAKTKQELAQDVLTDTIFQVQNAQIVVKAA